MFRILCGIVFAVIASSKGISAPLWGLLGSGLGVFGLIVPANNRGCAI